jgi:hypothetical protein
MLTEHRTRLLNVLARLDQLTAKVKEIESKEANEDDLRQAADLAADIQDALLRVSVALKSND